mmetsp:Transcript_27581/g.49727  ORF Transcript_27581/g.49727 Transcript_27581/m.49727 type:complete len:107 (+) Transcript_27581:2249-2569(+)
MPDKFEFLDFANIFRLPFTLPSLGWGVIIGTLLSVHQYNRTRVMRSSVGLGIWGAFLSSSGIWAYKMSEFSQTQYILRRQTLQRNELRRRAVFMEQYFRDKFQLHE